MYINNKGISSFALLAQLASRQIKRPRRRKDMAHSIQVTRGSLSVHRKSDTLTTHFVELLGFKVEANTVGQGTSYYLQADQARPQTSNNCICFQESWCRELHTFKAHR